jgi:hypothetical protein
MSNVLSKKVRTYHDPILFYSLCFIRLIEHKIPETNAVLLHIY